MYRRLFAFVKRRLPRISDTELIALQSGDTSVDRAILNGKVAYPPFFGGNVRRWDADATQRLLTSFDGSRIYPNDNDNAWIRRLAEERYFGFLIDEAYGGVKLSVTELSSLLTTIASRDPALGVVVMVPNSLGPGELLTRYGTSSQKTQYLPRLASGELIPCFGLTGPTNGSDATGTIDQGVVIQDGDGKVKIEVNLNKRYITLAPVANLMGIAFDVVDPDGLLGGRAGITVALVERDHPGLVQDTHHNPLDAGFPNGTIKGRLLLDTDQVIGGVENVGEGWKMLMECLSAGRGVSLPATANASSKVATFGIFHYIQARTQFKLALADMEAIQEKFLRMVYETWIIQSSIEMTNDILDDGKTPAVLSAIMKQQTTERARTVLNDAMDIHAGSAICKGPNNFLEKFYRSAPIGITVEGSNTLTRSLIIFAQGLNKSHPHIFPLLTSILEDDPSRFRVHFNALVSHAVTLYGKSWWGWATATSSLESELVRFATLTNFVALKGGALKQEQMLAGDMADQFSNLYLALGVRHFQKKFDASDILTTYVVDQLVAENRRIMNRVIDNLGPERFLLQHMKVAAGPVDTYERKRQVFQEIMTNPAILREIKRHIFTDGTILEDLERSVSDADLRDQVIQVGEFQNCDLPRGLTHRSAA
tara:strand:+ start:372 stop:2324 length:1953 start_codon:yes stop_codon:yes gene_type:complete